MDLGDLISAVAVVISAVSLGYSFILNAKQGKYIKSQDELNRILIEKERKERQQEEAADLSANIVEFGNGKYRIRVYNRGKARAESVDFDLIDTDWAIIDHVFPLEYLEPGKSVDLPLTLVMGSASKGKCRITWTDPTGKHKSETILVV